MTKADVGSRGGVASLEYIWLMWSVSWGVPDKESEDVSFSLLFPLANWTFDSLSVKWG